MKLNSYISYIFIFSLSLFISQVISFSHNNKFLSFKEESFSKEYINLVNYIIKNGGYISPKITINEISQTNRYILAKDNIKKNEKILFIPEITLISKLHIEVFKKCIDAYGLVEDHDYDCIVYFMTIDKYNTSSIFKPYYDYLPKIDKNDFIISLTEEEQEKYNETGLLDGIQSFYHFLNVALEPVQEKLKIFAEKNKISYEQILEDFFINFIMVGTRNFGRPDYIADFSTMVPYLDLINHSDKNNTFWFYDHNKEGYFLIADRDIKKNEEITDSYGRYCNSYLYKTYGFVIPGNIYNDRLYVKINNNIMRLDLDFFDDSIYHIFDKQDYNKVDFNEMKNNVLEILYEKKKYFENLKPERFALKIIFKKYIDILNEYIKKIKSISLSYIKNYHK